MLYPQERDPVSILQRAGWAPGPVRTVSEDLAFTGIQSPDRPARSEPLYRPSYPIPLNTPSDIKKNNVPAHTVKAYRGSRGIVPFTLSLNTVGREWSASRSGRFSPGDEHGH